MSLSVAHRTKVYTAKYTDKNGVLHGMRLRINPHLSSMVLAINLIPSKKSATISHNNQSKKEHIEDNSKSNELSIVEKLITEKTDMLYTKDAIIHKISPDETINTLAGKYGVTVSSIIHSNKDKVSPDGKVLPNSELLIEKLTLLSELDRDINMLETYIFDYVLRESSFAQVLNDKENNDDIRPLYNTLIYGNASGNSYNPQSIYGLSLKAYQKFHEAIKTESDNLKEQYKGILLNIVKDIEDKINYADAINTIIPFNEFRDYCINGTTKQTVTGETLH